MDLSGNENPHGVYLRAQTRVDHHLRFPDLRFPDLRFNGVRTNDLHPSTRTDETPDSCKRNAARGFPEWKESHGCLCLNHGSGGWHRLRGKTSKLNGAKRSIASVIHSRTDRAVNQLFSPSDAQRLAFGDQLPLGGQRPRFHAIVSESECHVSQPPRHGRNLACIIERSIEIPRLETGG